MLSAGGEVRRMRCTGGVRNKAAKKKCLIVLASGGFRRAGLYRALGPLYVLYGEPSGTLREISAPPPHEAHAARLLRLHPMRHMQPGAKPGNICATASSLAMAP